MPERKNRKAPFNCYLSVDQLDALDLASEREGRPRAEIIREAVSRYLTESGDLPEGDSPTAAGRTPDSDVKPRAGARGGGA